MRTANHLFDDDPSTEALRIYARETAPVLALRLDANDCVTDSNSQARRVLPGELLGRPFAELLVDFTRPPGLPTLLRQADTVHRFTLNTASGLPETMGFRCFPLPGGTLALGSLDVQEQQQLRDTVLGLNGELNNLTRQLHQANAELRELNQLKNEFLGMAAHDLRKPVGVILTYSEFVLDEARAQLSAEQQEFLRTSLAAASSMQRLIDDFLDVAIIESGKLRLDLALASVPEILAGALPIARLVGARKQITLLVADADPARRLRVDVSKLQQVVLNLVGNAVEHSVAGQRVWLSSHWDDQQLVLAVRDEGPGLTPEDQARLFQPFGRASTRKTSGERSVGLGLLIARKIVETHGGRFWVDSLPGQGATFLFSLPVPEYTQPTASWNK